MQIPFETNVSVPKGDESEGIVTQFFMRDPDGYYIELCNCDILTDFCLGSDKVKCFFHSCCLAVKSNINFSFDVA